MGLSSPGIGSNLDVSSIVKQLMAVEKQPITQLDAKTASFQAKLTGFGTLKSLLAQFQGSVSGLSDIAKFQAANTSIVDGTVASVTGTAAAVPGSYALEVSKLAQAQKLAAAGQVSSIAPIGSGAPTTLSFDFGRITGGTLDPRTGKYSGASFASTGTGIKTVTIGSNNSLSGIRDAINSAGVGVTATIINDGSGAPYRLSLTVGATGEDHSLSLSVTGDATIAGLLSHDPASDSTPGHVQSLSESVTAQNAQFKLDGIDVSKASNTVSDAIAGVTLTLSKTNVGTPTGITVARDTTAVKAGVNGFVKSFNDITKALKEASAYDPATRSASILNGEASVRSILTQIKAVLTAPVAGGASTYSLLSQVGVTVQKDGLLAVDNTKLQTALDQHYDQIAGLFANTAKTSDSLISYTGASAKTAPGAYPVTITQFATQGVTTASTGANLNISAGSNDTLDVKIDGLLGSITLTAGAYTSASLAKELQSKINGNSSFGTSKVTVAADSNGVLTVTSAAYGSGSIAEITGGNGKAALGFDANSSSSTGLDTVGTINGTAAIGKGQTLTGAFGNPSEGLVLKTNGSLGAGGVSFSGTVNYSQGYAYQLNRLATSLVAEGGPIASRTTGINASIKDIAAHKDALNARLAEVEKRYRAQFTALDTVISKMTTTSTFLTQQLANLPRSS